jgi:hypothetical protein
MRRTGFQAYSPLRQMPYPHRQVQCHANASFPRGSRRGELIGANGCISILYCLLTPNAVEIARRTSPYPARGI